MVVLVSLALAVRNPSIWLRTDVSALRTYFHFSRLCRAIQALQFGRHVVQMQLGIDEAVQLMIRGNAGRHIPPILYSVFCSSAGAYAECTSHNPPMGILCRNRFMLKCGLRKL
jgi:hypothetical protein